MFTDLYNTRLVTNKNNPVGSNLNRAERFISSNFYIQE